MRTFARNFFWMMVGFGLVHLIIPLSSFGQTPTWYPVEKGQWKTMAWDAVTALADGDPIPDPADATLTYNVYVKNKVTNAIIPIASGVTGTSLEMILPKRGDYFGGAEANLLYTGATTAMKSPISWSDTAASCQGGVTFGFRFQTKPGGPQKLR